MADLARQRRVRGMVWRPAVIDGMGLLACAGFGFVLLLVRNQMWVDDERGGWLWWLAGLVVLAGPFALFWILSALAFERIRRMGRILRRLRTRRDAEWSA